MERFNVTLDEHYAEKLREAAEHLHIQPGTLARTLICWSIDREDPELVDMDKVLAGIPGHQEALDRSLEQARRGETMSLDEAEVELSRRLKSRRKQATNSTKSA